MNFKSILVVGLGVATLGLTAPAHAQNDNATVIDNKQNTVLTGDGNYVNQEIKNKVKNRAGRNGNGSNGTSLSNDQNVDALGNGNVVEQKTKNNVDSRQQRPRLPR